MPALGDAFHFRVAAGHLWVVIAPPCIEGKFLMVNATSLDEEVEDTSCLLDAGDHDCIVHRSVIYYVDAREWWCDGNKGYTSLLSSNEVIPRDPLQRAILRRIQDGALASPFFKRKFAPWVQANLV